MKTLGSSSLVLLAVLVAACGGGGGYGNYWYDEPILWLLSGPQDGRPAAHLEVHNAEVTATGTPNPHAIVRMTYNGVPFAGLVIEPGGMWIVELDPRLDHVFEFEFDDGSTASWQVPSNPIRLEPGEEAALTVTY